MCRFGRTAFSHDEDRGKDLECLGGGDNDDKKGRMREKRDSDMTEIIPRSGSLYQGCFIVLGRYRL